MGDKPDEDGPSLELPSLLGRRKRTPSPAPTVEPGPDKGPVFALPGIPGRVAAVVTGVVVGVLGAGLTYGALQGCQSIRGTDSCGGSGIFVLLAVLLVMILVGAALLAAWKVPDPRSTSALGVGLLCVIVLLTLLEQLFSGWMFVVIPAVTSVGYAVAHWVTTAMVEDG